MNDALIELREETPDRLVLRGYASVAEVWYPVGKAFQEKVNRRAWQRSLAGGPDTVLLQDHSGLALARTKTPSGEPSLVLSEDDRGLYCEAFLDATAPRVQDLRSTAANSGLQMSVGFRCEKDSWNESRSRREVKQASIDRGDVTICNYGCNPATEAAISARGAAGEMERRMCPTEFERVRGRSQILVPTSIEEMKLRKVKLARRAELTVPHVTPRYSYQEIQKLGKEGYAHKRKDGKYNFPVYDKIDVVNAVHSIGRTDPGERLSVKRFIIYRAGLLHCEHLVPERWWDEVGEAMPEGLPR
ncbi:MAG TPA: HK97 family phage prohead protease [Solirubrobacteraceae bacterium]|nr:HK97 family phage prohead protease [Solirubrobacteraceae bacterium]